MRPEINDVLVDRIQALDDRHGYESVAEFIRDTTRQRVEELEQQRKEQFIQSAGEEWHTVEDIQEVAVGNGRILCRNNICVKEYNDEENT